MLTGFLGSGKTTLLRHLLPHPAFAGAAVVINEFGEVGLDHLLVGKIDDATVLLDNGCLCCSLRDDLVHTLRQLLVRRASGELPAFDRIIIETTGLAEPVSVVTAFLADALLADCCRLEGIVTTVDAVTGPDTLDEHIEAVRQVAVADRLLLTKTDLVPHRDVAAIEEKLRALNPAAPILPALNGEVEPTDLLGLGYYDPATGDTAVERWLAAHAYEGRATGHGHDHAVCGAGHGEVRSFCLNLDGPLPWRDFAEGLHRLTALHGARLLRMKGIVAVEGRPGPIVVQGVRHLLHPPVQLEAWPSDDHSSRLIFITQGLDAADVLSVLGESINSREVSKASKFPHRIRD